MFRALIRIYMSILMYVYVNRVSFYIFEIMMVCILLIMLYLITNISNCLLPHPQHSTQHATNVC